jgi:hypothetical protein
MSYLVNAMSSLDPAHICQALIKLYNISIFLIQIKQVRFEHGLGPISNTLTHNHAANVAHESIGRGGPNASTDAGSGQEESVDPRDRQKDFQISSKKSAWAPFANDPISGHWSKLINDGGTSAPLNLDTTKAVIFHLEAPETRAGAVCGNKTL